MASIELDRVLVQLVARWSSQVVLRFVSEAPLATISDMSRNAQQARRFGGLLNSHS